ncbi:hypothetical protein J6590_047587 [Homalodisca vitripennis]|nr:hypothetical protein J6590_047587 [Homalodisca vitripennis]
MAGCSRTLRDSEIDLVISSDCDDSSECSDVPELCEVVGGIEDVVRSDHSGRGSDGEPDNDLHQKKNIDKGSKKENVSEKEKEEKRVKKAQEGRLHIVKKPQSTKEQYDSDIQIEKLCRLIGSALCILPPLLFLRLNSP